jgi:ABC-2 type transport system permease protein
MRALFAGHPSDPSVWKAAVMLAVLAVLVNVWAGRQFARSIR